MDTFNFFDMYAIGNKVSRKKKIMLKYVFNYSSFETEIIYRLFHNIITGTFDPFYKLPLACTAKTKYFCHPKCCSQCQRHPEKEN